MGSKVTPEQYLATYYEREPEYVRGELKEKPSPDWVHSQIQALLGRGLLDEAPRCIAERRPGSC